MATPEERLCSWRWRLLNSIWVLWAILSFGTLAWIGFLYVAIKTRRPLWFLIAALWCVVGVGWFVASDQVDMGTKANPAESTASQLMSAWLFLGWLGSSIMAFFQNRSWLRWRAAHPRGHKVWYTSGATGQHQPTPSPVTHVSPIGPFQPPPMTQFGPPSTPERAAQAPPTSQHPARSHPQPQGVPSYAGPPVNINTAGPAELGTLGLHGSEIDRVLQNRAQFGPYAVADQLMTRAGLPPHVFLQVRDHVTVTQHPPRRDRPPSGRVLDL